MEEGFTFWSDRSQIIALLSKSQFDKLLDQKWDKKPEMKEVSQAFLFDNNDIILWKKGYGYDLKLFTKIKKLAKELELNTILMPDSDKEFPMAFANSERSVFLILAPKMFDGNDDVSAFARNWGIDSKEKDKFEADNNELKARLEKLKEIINQSGKEGKT
jgi:hypothetical protein